MSPLRRRGPGGGERVKLDVPLYDELAEARGLDTVSKQAEHHGVLRPHWSAIRNGHADPSAALCLRVSDQLATDPRAIWHREAVSADA